MAFMVFIGGFWMLLLRKRVPFLNKATTTQPTYQNQPVSAPPQMLQPPVAATIQKTPEVTLEKSKEA